MQKREALAFPSPILKKHTQCMLRGMSWRTRVLANMPWMNQNANSSQSSRFSAFGDGLTVISDTHSTQKHVSL